MRLIQSNNESTMVVLRSLLKVTAVKQGFFETVHYCLQNITKATMIALREML